jgi:hypothetical protein
MANPFKEHIIVLASAKVSAAYAMLFQHVKSIIHPAEHGVLRPQKIVIRDESY